MLGVVEQELGTEDSQRRGKQTCSAVGMAAGAAPRELARPPLDALEVARCCNEARDTHRRCGDGAESEGARPALAGAFVGEIRKDSGGLDDTASPRRQHGDHPATE